MAMSNAQSRPTLSGTRRKSGFPIAGRRFDLMATAFAVWVVIGIFVDVNAHNHGEVDNTFFTPWHFLLYSGVLANGVMLGIAQYRNVAQGYAWTRSLPKGYFLSQIGVLIFALGGVFDFIWHDLFGFEVNLEALLSPSHLILATGGILFIVGPLRSLWGRKDLGTGWANLFPAVASALMTMSILTLFTQYAHVITRADDFAADVMGRNTFVIDTSLTASVLIPAVLIAATLLLLIRRWQLPLGAVTFMLGVNSLLMFFLQIGHVGHLWPILIAPLAAGIIGDLIILRFRPSIQHVAALRVFAFVVPMSYMLFFFIVVMLTDGLWWTIHLWLGAAFMAGVTGLGLSYLVAPPTIQEEAA